MSLETWLAFTATSIVLLVIPGPTILLVVSYALGQGARVAVPMALGVALGDFTAMTLSMLGLGAVLAASAGLYTALKWIGAAYLVYLGVSLWRAGGQIEARTGQADTPPWRMFGHAWLTTSLNPKGITFFVAFLPQFLDPNAPLLPQMAIFEATFVLLALVNAFGYALLASRAGRFVKNPSIVRAINRTGGTLLIGAGVLTATSRAAAR